MTKKTIYIGLTILMLVNISFGQSKKNFWASQAVSTSKTPATEEMMREYQSIISKYHTQQNKLESSFFDKIKQADKNRLEEIFKLMDSSQQQSQKVMFLKPNKPFSKSVPTQVQFQKFKDSKVFGIWINDKKVSANELSKYNNTDFSHYYISKLYGAAKKGKKYTHQVDLMTNDYYKKYYNQTINNKESLMVIVKD